LTGARGRRSIVGVRVKTGLAIGMLALLAGGCHLFDQPADPSCQGDPVLKPCPCMDPRTPGCPAPPNDWGDNPSTMTKKPDAGVTK